MQFGTLLLLLDKKPCFNTVNGIRVHAIMTVAERQGKETTSFNTVNGIRVHAMGVCLPDRKSKPRCFNTVNGIRVHAIRPLSFLTHAVKFQYRKRYKGACNLANRANSHLAILFQYRKRYKGACNLLIL